MLDTKCKNPNLENKNQKRDIKAERQQDKLSESLLLNPKLKILETKLKTDESCNYRFKRIYWTETHPIPGDKRT